MLTPSIHHSTKIKGFTLTELLIAAAISSVVIAVALALTNASNGLLRTDQARTSALQSARGVMDIIGSDVRATGERLSDRSNIPISAIELADATTGDTLVLRSNLLYPSLPLCENAGENDKNLIVSRERSKNGGFNFNDFPACTAIDNDADGWADNVQIWQEYISSQTDDVFAYIYTSGANGEDEFFKLESVRHNEGNGRFLLRRPNVSKRFNLIDNATILILEERTYQLNNGVLELIVNRDTANPIRLINDVTAFQIQLGMKDGTTALTLDNDDKWQDVVAINVSITVQARQGQRLVERTLTSSFFPRNVLSN